MDDKPHISPSQIATITRCGVAWYRRYICGDKVPPGFAALIGSGVHGGAQVNFQQKIASYTDLPPSQIRDAAVAEMDNRLGESGVMLQPGENLDIETGKARDMTAAMALNHAIIVAPDYQPVAVEQKVLVPLPALSHDLLGIVDLIDDKHRVIDFKTTGRRKKQQEADESLALTSYAVFVGKQTGKLPESLVLDVTMRNEKHDRDILVTHRDKTDIKILVDHIQVVLAGIKSGVFMPAPKGSWYCSAKWCGYHSTCKYVKH